MTSDSTRHSSSKDVDKSSAAYLKRREQVRRAQRTHRERKETYIHALESEVLALRTKARSVEEQNDELSRQVKQLKRKLNAQAVGGSVGWDNIWEDGSEGTEDAGPMSLGRQRSVGDEDIGSSMGEGQEQWIGMSVNVPPQTCGATIKSSGWNSWSLSASHADMAMEFVLTLEKPCIMWAQSAVFDPLNAYPSNLPQGQNELALYHSFVEEKLAAPTSCTQQDVASSLDNLLNLSSAFNLEYEVTPIQAWQHLCGYFELGAIDMKNFRKLADMLLEHVRCYG
ncbi:hypothetical protein N0V86_003653 [Didymella sp. IMI 355093]|nr:hypothetical protein N0V86_003653 [Didymella sp. IMI 355093]